MSTDAETLVVDRIEGGRAVLVTEAGETLEIARALLPRAAGEGTVVRAPRGPEGALDWGKAVVDEQATRARRADAEGILGELKRRDPGGDVAL